MAAVDEVGSGGAHSQAVGLRKPTPNTFEILRTAATANSSTCLSQNRVGWLCSTARGPGVWREPAILRGPDSALHPAAVA